MAVAVRTCQMGEDDDFTLDVFSCALGGGRSSRLYKKMVLDEGFVTDVSTHNEPRLDPGVFWFTFELCPGVELARVESCLRDELQKIEEKGLTENELRRARIQIESSFLFQEETALDSAMKIGRWEAQCQGGYRRLAEVGDRYAAVDSAAVQSVVQRRFSPSTWNVVHSLPEGQVVANG